jgi:hypothetical protein
MTQTFVCDSKAVSTVVDPEKTRRDVSIGFFFCSRIKQAECEDVETTCGYRNSIKLMIISCYMFVRHHRVCIHLLKSFAIETLF